jgi:hypothetical protein
MAQLQLIVEEVADAEQPLATAFQQDRGMPWGVTGGADDADAGEDLGVMAERAQWSPKSLIASRADARCSSAVAPAACAPDQKATSAAWANPVAQGNVSSPDQVAPRQWS